MNKQVSIYAEVECGGQGSSFYQMIEKEATKKVGKSIMEAYQKKS